MRGYLIFVVAGLLLCASAKSLSDEPDITDMNIKRIDLDAKQPIQGRIVRKRSVEVKQEIERPPW